TAAPVGRISPQALAGLFTALTAAGLDIESMNRIRRRFLRWGGGRLAQALRQAKVRVLAISDVPGDDPAVIGSGPCMPDPATAAEIRQELAEVGLDDRIDREHLTYLDQVIAGLEPETPKPGDFATPSHTIILSNTDACNAAAEAARTAGYEPVSGSFLTGEAVTAGRAVAKALREATPGLCLIWGGETTVALGADHGIGGRSQTLALA